MNSDQHQVVAGVAAFAFGESGNGVLEALAKRAKDFERPLITRVADPVSFDDDLFSVMSGLLSPKDRTTEPVDVAHVLIVADGQVEEHSDAFRAVCAALRAAREKFQSRMGRAILAVRSRFEPVGRATKGRIRSSFTGRAPRRGGGVEAFDLVVLLDAQKAEVSPLPAPEGTEDNHAAILANLMLSDFEESIYKLLEHQRGPLGFDGRFASFGVSELSFSSQEAVQSIAAVLWRRMARKTLDDALTPVSAAASREPWKEDVEDRLTTEPFESADTLLITKFHRQGGEKLQRSFEESSCHPGVLLRLLAEREECLIRFRDKTRARLSAFMDEFVPRQFSASPQRDRDSVVPSYREYGWTRIALLVLCLFGFSAVLLGNLLAGSETLRFPGLLLLTLLLGSAITLLLTRNPGTTPIVETAKAPAAEPQRDVMGELRRYRASGEIASGLLKRHRKLRKAIETDIEALQAELSRPYAPKAPVALALPENLIDELLTANGLDAQQALLEFWEQPEERLAARPTAREKSLPHRLRRFAANRCSLFTGLRTNDVLGYLGGPAALDNPQISREIDRLQRGSTPRMPVEGLASGIIVALPESLNPELRHSIAQRFQDPVFVVPTRRESIVALQWTQGYAEAEAGAATRALAL